MENSLKIINLSKIYHDKYSETLAIKNITLDIYNKNDSKGIAYEE